jgi:hypothetical protein
MPMMLKKMSDLKCNIGFLKLLCYNDDINLNLMELLISLTGFSDFSCEELECQKDFSYVRLFRTCLEHVKKNIIFCSGWAKWSPSADIAKQSSLVICFNHSL